MTAASDDDSKTPDPSELNQTLAGIAEQSQRMVSEFLRRQEDQGTVGMADSHNIGKAFLEMTQRLMSDPSQLVKAQLTLWHNYLALWQSSTATFWGKPAEPIVAPDKDDRRFSHQDWNENFVFDFIKQSYLLTARWLQSTISQTEGLDEQCQRKLDFYTRQFVDAMAPTNFPLTNPEVLRATLDSGGDNLVKGLQNLLADLDRGRGRLNIRQADLEAFEIGRNVAVTTGQVIYQNDLMQLIQYDPTTQQVFQHPLLIVPPWFNKYYVLDLRPENSLIKWWVEQGFTVFVISWVNPDQTLADKDFQDYMEDGPLAALRAIEAAIGEREVNLIGYCLGGVLSACTAAYLASRRQKRIKSCTYFATLLDFEQPGELEVFIDEEELTALEQRMDRTGYLEGSDMATTFNMLRANDLIWSFFVNSYLLGKEPFPFDLLYWNSDSTRMPAKMQSFYLRNMYQNNLLKEPGGISLLGKPIDLSKIKAPTYYLATIEDHIAPWQSLYSSAQLFSGPLQFVLGGSGHTAGVINPPANNKYCYWTNEQIAATGEAWLDGAQRHTGSWWGDWLEWVRTYAGPAVPSRQAGSGKLPALETAPGSYVKVRY